MSRTRQPVYISPWIPPYSPTLDVSTKAGQLQWTIPVLRTKGNREHRVPLSRGALEILEEARALGGGSSLIFPRVGGKPIGNTVMSELLRGLKIAAVPHGFRSSFRDWVAEETDHPREVAEAALARKVRNPIEAAYRRTDLFERRRRLMDDWADYLDLLKAVNE